MPKDMPLDAEQRRIGQKRHRLFMWLNAVPVAFLMENVLVLYGIRNGMADSSLAVLASFIHLTMPFMIFGRNLIARFGLAKAWALGWGLRYTSVLIILFAPWAQNFGQWAASAVIMLGAFGFALFRSLGAINSRPLIGEITTRDERGRFIYGNFARFTTVHLLSMTVAVLLMRSFEAVWVYQLIILTGALVGFIGSYVLTTIPESGETRKVATAPLGKEAKELFQDDVRRRTVWAFGAGFTSFVLVIPFATITIKNGYGVPDSQALVLTLLVVAGGIISSLVNREISDHVGPRPLLVIYTFGFFAVASFWAFAPATLNPVIAGATFLVAGYCKTGLLVGLGHYLLSTTPGKHRLATTLFSEMFGGAAAGLAGSVLGGTLIALLQDVETGIEVYRWYFRVVAVIVAGLIFVMARLKRVEDWRVPEVLGLVFSPRDVWALVTLNRLEDRSNVTADLHDVARLRQTRSSLSQARLRQYVDSPRLEVRMQALRALRTLHMDRESLNVVVEQIDSGVFTTAWLAADMLGERGVAEAIGPLRRALDSADPFLVGKAMVNLVRLGDSESYDRIRRQFREAEHVRVVMYGGKAIARMGDMADLQLLLHKACGPGLPAAVRDEVLIGAASLCGVEDRYYRLIRTHRDQPDAALSTLLGELDDPTWTDFAAVWGEGKPKRAVRLLADAAARADARCSGALTRFLEEVKPAGVDARAALCVVLLATSACGEEG